MNMLTRSLAAGLVMATFSGCANMNAQQKNTAIGAAVGGVAGSVLTGGSAALSQEAARCARTRLRPGFLLVARQRFGDNGAL